MSTAAPGMSAAARTRYKAGGWESIGCFCSEARKRPVDFSTGLGFHHARGSGFLDLVFHAVAFALDGNGFGMVEQPVQNGGGQCGIVVEDFGIRSGLRFSIGFPLPPQNHAGSQ